MKNTEEIQVAPGSRSLERQQHSKSGVSGFITCDSLQGRRDRAGPVETGQRGGNEPPPVEVGGLGARAGSPSGGIRLGPRVPSRPFRISGRTRLRPASPAFFGKGCSKEYRLKAWSIKIKC